MKIEWFQQAAIVYTFPLSFQNKMTTAIRKNFTNVKCRQIPSVNYVFDS